MFCRPRSATSTTSASSEPNRAARSERDRARDSFQNRAPRLLRHEPDDREQRDRAADGVSTGYGEKAASVVLRPTQWWHGLRGPADRGNTIRVTGAQDAAPEWIYGIWENSSANSSNITIRGNSLSTSPDNLARPTGSAASASPATPRDHAVVYESTGRGQRGLPVAGRRLVLSPPPTPTGGARGTPSSHAWPSWCSRATATRRRPWSSPPRRNASAW